MIDGIERYYQRIGNSIQGAMAGPWVRAWMEGVFYRDHTDFYGEYVASDDSKSRSYLTGRDGRRAMEELRELFKTQGNPLWCRARFELSADGKFKITWGYDESDEDGYARYDDKGEDERT